MEIIEDIWNFQYAVIPCLVAYLIFDIPIIYRRITRKLYVPIYFAFFPFGYSDELYARYFDEDVYCEVGGAFREEEVSAARTKIIWVSILSLALTMALSPFLAAMFSHYFLTSDQQIQFFYTLAVVKAIMLALSLYDMRWQYTVTDVVPYGYIATIYIIFWVALLTFYDRSFDWIVEKANVGGLHEIGEGLLDFVIFDVGIGILFVSVIGFLIPWRLTNGTAKTIESSEPYDQE